MYVYIYILIIYRYNIGYYILHIIEKINISLYKYIITYQWLANLSYMDLCIIFHSRIFIIIHDKYYML